MADLTEKARCPSVAADQAIAEGDLVCSTNTMYKEYGVGRMQKVRNGMAKIEFNPSVFMEPPYRSENKILPLTELEKVDTPLDRAARGNWGPAWRFELKMLAARLLTGNKGGQLSNARTEILPHQIFTAHRVVSSPRRRVGSPMPPPVGWLASGCTSLASGKVA